jgi:hypothetical protein
MSESKLAPGFIFENGTGERIVVQLEPWGEDYHLAPGDRIALMYSDRVGFIHVTMDSGGVGLWVEGGWDYPQKVLVNEHEAACGYGRPAEPSS